MRPDESLQQGFLSASIDMRVGGKSLHFNVTVPNGDIEPTRMLPIFRDFAEKVVGVAVRETTASGKQISCKAGCGACCRQLVPISQIEAERLHEVVKEMSDDRRDEILRRFESARMRLASTGLLEILLEPESIERTELRRIGLDYFALGIACPFLEYESCSIYDERPIACREYLVTSPAENCSKPTAESVEIVKLPRKISNAVSRIGEGERHQRANWFPLILAVRSSATVASGLAMPATEIFEEFVSKLGE